MAYVKKLEGDKLASITAQSWAKCISKVMTVEDQYWKTDKIQDCNIPKVLVVPLYYCTLYLNT